MGLQTDIETYKLQFAANLYSLDDTTRWVKNFSRSTPNSLIFLLYVHYVSEKNEILSFPLSGVWPSIQKRGFWVARQAAVTTFAYLLIKAYP